MIFSARGQIEGAIGDRLTRERLRQLDRIRIWVPVAMAAVLGGLLVAIFPVDPAAALLEVARPLLAFSPAVEQRAEAAASGHGILRWLTAPVLFGFLGYWAVRRGPCKDAMRQLLPDPPWFVASSLDDARAATMIKLERAPLPIVGRTEAVAELERTLGAAGPAFSWRVAYGRSGIGKTRLAIEWLATMERRQWDVGIVTPIEIERLRGWRARKPTALLIDDASRVWSDRLGELLTALRRGCGPTTPVRVLVVNQQPFAVDASLGVARSELRADQISPQLHVPGLAKEDLRELAAQAGCQPDRLEQVIDAADGRARALLILARSTSAPTVGAAAAEWAMQMLPEALDDRSSLPIGVSGPLLLAALASPIPTDAARKACGEIDTLPLLRFFDEAEGGQLHSTIPPLRPDELALAVTLLLILRIDEERLRTLIAAAVRENVAMVEDRLASAWRAELDYVDLPLAKESLVWLQREYDELVPDRVAAAHRIGETLLASLAAADDLKSAEGPAAALLEMADSRPFDPVVRTQELKSINRMFELLRKRPDSALLLTWEGRLARALRSDVVLEDAASLSEGAATALKALEVRASVRDLPGLVRWANELYQLHDLVPRDRSAGISGLCATGYSETIHAIGLHRRFADLEAWAGVLDELRSAVGERPDRDLVEAEAYAATRSMCVYARAGRFRDVERWWRRLLATTGRLEYDDDADIRFYEASAAADLMGHVQSPRGSAELERWGAILLALTTDARFAGNHRFKLLEAEGAVMAVTQYATAGEANGLEKWCSRLVDLVEEGDAEIETELRIRELNGIGGAILCYGHNGKLSALDRWTARFIQIVDDERFMNDAAICEAELASIMNMVAAFGRYGRYADMERWGKRAVQLSDKPAFWGELEIQERAAKATGNILNTYARAGRFDTREAQSWFEFIARIAQHYPEHPGVQEVAGAFGVTATDQLLAHFSCGRFDRRVAAPVPRRTKRSRGWFSADAH